ncbi:hypothetical protein [Amycolatopsis xylanica]|nr:hypothetical protein [Amycolatopsis xylanica]
MVQDFEHETVELVRLDGQRIQLSSPGTSDPYRTFLSATYDFVDRVLILNLVHGDQVEVEIGGFPDDDHRRGDRLCVYLDQNQWIKLAQYVHTPDKLTAPERAAAETVCRWARDQRILLPLSGAHLTEIASARSRYRNTLVPLMLELCRGWQMRSPIRVRQDELRAMFRVRQAGQQTSEEARPAVFTLEPGALFGTDASPPTGGTVPPEFAELHRRVTWVTAMYSSVLDDEPIERGQADELADRWAKSLHELAVELKRNTAARENSRTVIRTRLIVDMRDDVIEAALAAGMPLERFEAWHTEEAEQDLLATPYVGTVYEATHARLRNAGDVWHGHDLNDLLYLACASAYADVVACENKAADYLARAWRSRSGGAKLVKTLPALVEHLQPILR